MIKSIASVKVSDRRVLLRAGFDVPLKKNSHGELEVVDDTRIRDNLQTLNYLIKSRARIVIISKLGRPDHWDEDCSLWPVAEKLGEIIGYKVVRVSNELPDYPVPHIYFLSADITKKDYSELSEKVPVGSILILENLFFYPGEQDKDPKFAKILSKFGDVYVDEAFASAHHAAASNVLLPKDLPSYAGISFLNEISKLRKLTMNPARPFVLLMGGAKIEEKVETIKNLAPNTEKILIGGGLCNTFFKAQGYEIGKSKVSDPGVAKDLLRNYKEKIVLPVDVVVSTSPDGEAHLRKIEKVGKHEMILDIGPETVRKFSGFIKTAKTLAWNGPMGLFEKPKFAFGTKNIAHIFAARSKGHAYGVIGGGETIEAVDQAKMSRFIDHISTGGGAMLEFLAGKTLPAIKALDK